MFSLCHLGILASFSYGDSQGFFQHGASVHVVNVIINYSTKKIN